jgi:hypothetical protein
LFLTGLPKLEILSYGVRESAGINRLGIENVSDPPALRLALRDRPFVGIHAAIALRDRPFVGIHAAKRIAGLGRGISEARGGAV